MKKNGFTSIIAKKITLRMSFVYLGIYLFILLLLIGVLAPRLYREENKKALNTISLVADEFDRIQTQIGTYMNAIYYYDNLIAALADYEQNPNEYTESTIRLELGNFSQISASINTVSLETRNHAFFDDYYFNEADKEEYLHNTPHYMKLFEQTQGSLFTYAGNSLLENINLTSDYYTMTYSKIIYFHDTPYVITIFADISYLFKQCNQLMESYMDDFLIRNWYMEEIFSTNPEWSANETEFLSSNQKLLDYKADTAGVYYYAKIPSSNWCILSFSPYTKLLANLFTILGIITLLYLISPVLYCVFLIPTTQRLLSPLKILSNAMKTYSAGDKLQLSLETGDEIQELNDSFNQMVCQINSQIESIRQQEHENSVVSYKLLATQIDPHFIYNSMNIINIMARRQDMNAVIEINSALIRILRERLNSKMSIYDTVENEIQTLMQYETIMHYRYENHVQIHYDIDETLSSRIIPKNILQPLVENAFFHGFNSTADVKNGSVDVMIYKGEDEMVIEVSDNGKGIESQRIEQLLTNDYRLYEDKKPHIGIDNIRQRLAYLYKNNYTLDIQSTLGLGTNIIITIPLQPCIK